MKRAAILLVSVMVVGAGFLVWQYSDQLPPRRPFKIARVISGLPVPKDSDVLEFRDEWRGFSGDGEVKVVLQLTTPQFEELMRTSRERGYQDLDLAGTEIPAIIPSLGTRAKGLYRFSGSIHDHYELVVLESVSKRMYVAVGVQ